MNTQQTSDFASMADFRTAVESQRNRLKRGQKAYFSELCALLPGLDAGRIRNACYGKVMEPIVYDAMKMIADQRDLRRSMQQNALKSASERLVSS